MILEFLPHRACDSILPTLMSVSFSAAAPATVKPSALLYRVQRQNCSWSHGLMYWATVLAGSGKCQGESEDVKAQSVHQRVLC